MLPNLYDVYISIPLRIERSFAAEDEDALVGAASAGRRGGGRRERRRSCVMVGTTRR